MEVKINREIRNYTESMFFGLSMRQHGVTREQLARLADYDGMDVMKLYDRQAARGAQGRQKKELER